MRAGSGLLQPSPHLLLAAVLAESRPKERAVCDACGAEIQGEPAGKGILIWARGDTVREEEAPLCEACAQAIAVASIVRSMGDDGE